MVTSSLSSANVPCDVYPLTDKKKLKSKSHSTVGSLQNKATIPSYKSKENIAKHRLSTEENKQPDHNSSKDKICEVNGTDPPGFITGSINDQNKIEGYRKPHSTNISIESSKNHQNINGSTFEEVGKILQEVLWKTPLQNQERENMAVAELSSGGTDTGYSSRCSTPPTSVNNGHTTPDEEPKDRVLIEKVPEVLLSNKASSEANLESFNKSHIRNNTSNNAWHSSKHVGRNKIQGHQRFNNFHYHSQKPFPRAGYFIPYANSVGYVCNNQRYEDNNSMYGSNGKIRCHVENGSFSNSRKGDRLPVPHGIHQYNQNSSQESRENESWHPNNAHGCHFTQGHNQRNDRGRNCKFQPIGKNRFYGNSYHQPPSYSLNGLHHQQNLYNICYQLNSQHDLRECVWGFRRTLTDPAGTFNPPVGAHSGKWIKDYRSEAKVIPPELLNHSKWDDLSLQVWNLFAKHQQLDSTFQAKMELKERISQVIWNVLPTCRLFVVGSSLSGFGANSSDVDMCLMVTPRDLDQRNEAQAVLRLLQRELLNCGFVEKMELITAKVPILKFRDCHTKIDVDLNCNNSVGIRNTHLLNAYSQLDWRVRPLVLVVKLWAQHHHINNAKDMTISSYSLVLMVIHYLQCGLEKPLLPCLHKAYPDKFNSTNHVFKMPVAERLPGFTSNNTQTLGELFLGFLEYYAFKFTFIENTISVRTGGLLPTEDCRYTRTKKNDSRMWKYLCIEEPFDLTNTARSVYDEVVFEKVKNVFKESHKLLAKSKDLQAIFSDIKFKSC